MNIFYYTTIETPFGTSLIASIEDRICWFSFKDNGERFKQFLSSYVDCATSSLIKSNFSLFRKNYPDIARMIISKKYSVVEDKTRFDLPVRLINDYFEGKEVSFSGLNLTYLTGTYFQQQVWDTLRNIPYGKVISYKELALKAGKPGASRAAGTANSKNLLPLIVPCHRVIKSDGKIGGYSGGTGIKEKLLTLENNSFVIKI